MFWTAVLTGVAIVFAMVLNAVSGRRLDYKTLTGKTLGLSPA